MPRVSVTARVVIIAVVCAVGASVATATEPAAGAKQATSVALLRASRPRVGASTRDSRSPGPVTARVGGAADAAATPTAQGFLGIAAELSTIPVLAGPATDLDIPFVYLLKSLSPDAPFLLRLGGVSTNFSWWAVPGLKKPPGLYTLTPQWGMNVHALLKALGGKAILGVNLEAAPNIDSKIARVEVADFDRYVGESRIDAFELGNEPERVVGNTTSSYGKQFSRVAAALGRVPLAGPGSVEPVWLHQLGTVLHDLPPRLKLVTVHAYPLKNCSPHAHLSVSDFFTRASIQGLADSVHAEVKAAAADGKPLRVDEINGITCGGQAGLSNSFGEALWALNVLPALWRAGVQGVNFQTIDGNHNQLITAKHSAIGWRVSVEPEYYGLRAFTDVAPAGSHLRGTTDPGLANFYEFAVRAPNRSERVVLTNVGSVTRTINVTAPGIHGTGSVSLLSARSLSATSDTTLGGQRLSPSTGQLTGTPRLTRVTPNTKGAYTVRVPAHTAAILTLSA